MPTLMRAPPFQPVVDEMVWGISVSRIISCDESRPSHIIIVWMPIVQSSNAVRMNAPNWYVDADKMKNK